MLDNLQDIIDAISGIMLGTLLGILIINGAIGVTVGNVRKYPRAHILSAVMIGLSILLMVGSIALVFMKFF